ncbi:sigma-70 family RNA polymerase sigma factor [Singulisphaera sp. PoT]|uniref:sigma-70 family RNA polymerase sigma factor n=1 Tax=Singulisphaera sp. PoT TaxID=3411797 RepID=UPI003BF539F0
MVCDPKFEETLHAGPRLGWGTRPYRPPSEKSFEHREGSWKPEREMNTTRIQVFLDLANRGARKVARRRQDVDDYTQDAYLGVRNAVKNFDPDRGTPFEHYAVHCARSRARNALRRDSRWYDAMLASARLRREAVDQDASIRLDAEALLRGLEGRAGRIVRLRFGFEGGGKATWAEIGRAVGLSEHSARKQFKEAIEALRKRHQHQGE